jgi:hypothetical protein
VLIFLQFVFWRRGDDRLDRLDREIGAPGSPVTTS